MRGVELRFSRALQVEADRPMEPSFSRSALWSPRVSWLLLPGLVAVLAGRAGGRDDPELTDQTNRP